MDSLSGSLLVATPDLADPNFHRSVVLLLQHTAEGAMGVILNKPTSTTVDAVWDEISQVECECQDPVYCGGPVEGPLLAVHEHREFNENLIIEGVSVSTRREILHALVMQDEFRFRIIADYSGWGPGQLDQEVEYGGWLILPATDARVFGQFDLLWKNVCEHVGDEVLKPHIGRLKPTDPTLN